MGAARLAPGSRRHPRRAARPDAAPLSRSPSRRSRSRRSPPRTRRCCARRPPTARCSTTAPRQRHASSSTTPSASPAGNAVVDNGSRAIGARREGRCARARRHAAASHRSPRRRLHRALEHRLRRRPPRAGRARVRGRRRDARRRTAVLGATRTAELDRPAAARRCTSSGSWSAAALRSSGCWRAPCSAERLLRPLAHLLFFALLARSSAPAGSSTGGRRHALRARHAGRRDRRAGGRRRGGARRRVYHRLLYVAGAVRARAARGADPRRARARPRPAALARGAGRPRPRGVGGRSGSAGSSRSSSSCRARPATTRRAVADRAPLLDGGGRSRCACSALSGLGRALTELHSVSQVWSTSYGRALIVKTVIFVPLLGLGWLNRTLLAGRVHAASALGDARSRCCSLAIVVAVAVLTELAAGHAPTARPRQPPRRSRLRSRRCCRRATRSSTRASSGAWRSRSRGRRGRATVTISARTARASNGRDVRDRRRAATACGSGCYRAAGRRAGPRARRRRPATLTFDVAATAPDGTALLRARDASVSATSRTVVFDEHSRLVGRRSAIRHALHARRARTGSRTRPTAGPRAIVIGARRWDRDAAGQAVRRVAADAARRDCSPTGRPSSNVHEIAPGVLTFLDRACPRGSG